MTKFVIELEVMVPQWVKQSRHYYFDEDKAAMLIGSLTAEQNKVLENTDELRDLLTTKGTISTTVKLGGQEEEVKRMLRALAKSAWRYSVPWSVDETEYAHMGDEQFFDYKRAYVVSDVDYDNYRKKRNN